MYCMYVLSAMYVMYVMYVMHVMYVCMQKPSQIPRGLSALPESLPEEAENLGDEGAEEEDEQDHGPSYIRCSIGFRRGQ